MKTFFTAWRHLFFKIGPFGRSVVVLVALLMFSGILSAQTPQLEWIRQFGTLGPVADSPAAIDAQGNVYMAGNSSCAIPGQSGDLGGNIFLYKFDSDGIELWVRTFGSPKDDNARDILVDATGIYVVGATYDALPGQMSAGDYDAFICKYDFDGNELWTRQFGSTYADMATAIAADDTGIYVAGEASGALPGQIRVGWTDAFIRKYDTNGSELWTCQFGQSGTSFEARSISANLSGIYVAGNIYYGTAFITKFDSNGNRFWTALFQGPSLNLLAISTDSTGLYVAGGLFGTLPGQIDSGLSDAFLRKYDFSGSELWTRQFGSIGYDYVTSVSCDSTGIYVTGYTTGALPGQVNAGEYSYDAFIRKYDPAGNELWTRQFGTPEYEQATAVTVDDSAIYVAGYTTGPLDGLLNPSEKQAFLRKCDSNGNEVWTREFGLLGPASDSIQAISTYGLIFVAGKVNGALPGQVYHMHDDVFVRAYDSAGNEVWTRQLGTDINEEVTCISANYTGVYVAGWTYGAFPGHTNPGVMQCFIRKYDLDGNEMWTDQFGQGRPGGISADTSGVYLTGTVYGALPGQTPLGGNDAFLRKYSSNGIELWTRQFGTIAYDYVNGLCIDSTGIYIAGETSLTYGMGIRDAIVWKYTTNGDPVWVQKFGTAGTDVALSVSADNTAVYVLGSTNGVFPGQTKPQGYSPFIRKYDFSGIELWTRQYNMATGQAVGIFCDQMGAYVGGEMSGDASISNYDPDGNLLWTTQLGTSKSDYVRAFFVDSVGIYIGGNTLGAFPAQTYSGGGDAWFAKLKKLSGPPVANAGLDQEIEATGQTTSFSLDGTASSDPDGDVLTYKWEDANGNGVGESSIVTLERTLGTYTFKLTVKDPENMSSEDTVTITIHDMTPPSLTAPPDLTVDQSDPYGTAVSLGNPTVSDLCDPSPTVVKYAPDLFPLGETVVTWTATDASGNSSTAQQNVTVVPGSPANQLSNLTKLIQYSVAAGTIDPELETSLLAKIAAAADALAKANPSAATVAMNDLKALVNQVEAQTDKKITPAIAAEIIAWANGVITSLGG